MVKWWLTLHFTILDLTILHLNHHSKGGIIKFVINILR
jgi:hypothetical protein